MYSQNKGQSVLPVNETMTRPAKPNNIELILRLISLVMVSLRNAIYQTSFAFFRSFEFPRSYCKSNCIVSSIFHSIKVCFDSRGGWFVSSIDSKSFAISLSFTLFAIVIESVCSSFVWCVFASLLFLIAGATQFKYNGFRHAVSLSEIVCLEGSLRFMPVGSLCILA